MKLNYFNMLSIFYVYFSHLNNFSSSSFARGSTTCGMALVNLKMVYYKMISATFIFTSSSLLV